MPGLLRQAFFYIREEEEEEYGESINGIEMLNIHQDYDADNQLRDSAIKKNDSDRVTILSFVSLIFGIVFHVADLGLDINLAIEYFWEDKILYFTCTIMFIFLPTIVNTSISFRLAKWQIIHNQTSTAVAWKKKSWSRALVHLLHLAPIFYNSNSLRYAWKSRKFEDVGDRDGQRRYYRKMNDENEELALLKIFDAFLEAAPQQVLQITILLKDYDTTTPSWRQIGSLFTSFVSMGLTLVSYHRVIRLAEKNTSNINMFGLILQFLWHFFIAVSRIVSIGVVASKWPIVALVCCFVHWLVMTGWLINKPYGITSFCRNNVNSASLSSTPKERARSVLFACALGLVYIFTHLNPGEQNTYNRHLVYYSLCGIENIAAAIFWAFGSDESIRSYWFFELLICLCVVPFFLGILSMIIYYRFSHPTLNRRDYSSEQMPPLLNCGADVLSCLSVFVFCHFT